MTASVGKLSAVLQVLVKVPSVLHMRATGSGLWVEQTECCAGERKSFTSQKSQLLFINSFVHLRGKP
jgi:hypothetical protein